MTFSPEDAYIPPMPESDHPEVENHEPSESDFAAVSQEIDMYEESAKIALGSGDVGAFQAAYLASLEASIRLGELSLQRYAAQESNGTGLLPEAREKSIADTHQRIAEYKERMELVAKDPNTFISTSGLHNYLP